jgi:hypothetical protein
MTITLEISSEQEHRLRAGAAQHDAQAVRDILLEAVDPTVEALLRTSAHHPQVSLLPAILDKIAAQLRDAPALSDEAVSRAGIYADHL